MTKISASELRTKPFIEAIKMDSVDKGVRIIEYQPGNGTRYVFSIHTLCEFSDYVLERCGVTKETFIISLITFPKDVRSIVYSKHMLIDIELIKRFGMGPADTEVIGEFLAFIFGKEWDSN